MTNHDYQDLSFLMRDLMVKWKDKDTKKVVKEVSMPDMIDIICRHTEVTNVYDFIKLYWDQINEERDPLITDRLGSVLDSRSAIVWNLCGTQVFSSKELGEIIKEYIDSTPVIYI